MLCLLCLFLGFILGDWKEGAAVSKAIKEFADEYSQNKALLLKKFIDSRKDKKDGE